mmetsp:Transcript_46967/g.92719  ORF Transcript_46967/g.92719 Transcript_46967/m.92719 type:complete len:182 (-) Transcript_46967:1521-2066(-)
MHTVTPEFHNDAKTKLAPKILRRIDQTVALIRSLRTARAPSEETIPYRNAGSWAGGKIDSSLYIPSRKQAFPNSLPVAHAASHCMPLLPSFHPLLSHAPTATTSSSFLLVSSPPISPAASLAALPDDDGDDRESKKAQISEAASPPHATQLPIATPVFQLPPRKRPSTFETSSSNRRSISR